MLTVETVGDACQRLGITLTVNDHDPNHATNRLLGRTGHLLPTPAAMLDLVENFFLAVEATSGRIQTRPKYRGCRWNVCDAYGRVEEDGPLIQIVLNPDFRSKVLSIKTVLRVKPGRIPIVVAQALRVTDDDYYNHRGTALGDFLEEDEAASFRRNVGRRDRRNGGDSAAPVEGL